MPVIICTKPRHMAPMSIIMVSFSGVNRAGSPCHVVSGLIILATCSGASEKKPPVIAPQMVVDMPHQSISSKKLRMPLRGLALARNTAAAITMSMP